MPRVAAAASVGARDSTAAASVAFAAFVADVGAPVYRGALCQHLSSSLVIS
ncbi:MAG TPA: hypothetical protein VFG92_06325 [Agromyces sp.]|nr:hypothetical protein [Agromyces sp.]